MKQLFNVLGALVLGAGAMYYLDPEQGRRRRALVADRVDSLSHDARDYLEGQRKRTADRVRGLMARARSRMRSEPPSDEQLHGQIRSRLGRAVSYPHAIETEVRQGRVILRGAILANEYNAAMVDLWAIRGVTGIDSQLTLHTDPSGVPGMQGKPHRTRGRRLRNFARLAATVLAVVGGIGAGFGARRTQGMARAGALSLAMTLLAYGFGDSTRRIVRRRRARPAAPKEGTVQALPEGAPIPTGETARPATAWH